eukprot:CAMPEP_0172751272 /NCGR_PEP_ID=MMETSP1074-20121228/151244_1 /TAXON_ID=2916 /ORGANISM="Ceratium fusus, Strain PA161109" /LENGTH=295 /DNA_ID=CAMNT_0013583551 /DNA_START=26 /DNA_END=909 /DNA_ORIENTATION=-
MGDAISKAGSCSQDVTCRSSTVHCSGPSGDGLNSSPVKGPERETLIVFDWDDTLLCSSAINVAQWNLALLKQLERLVEATLQLSMGLGETIIVTNGNVSWVQDSANQFLPGLVPLLNRLHVISARALYEEAYPGDPFSWKRQAFKEVMKTRRMRVQQDNGINLVVLGDSPAEMEAAHSAAKVFAGHSLVKTVKFKEAPTAQQLLGQLQRVCCELGTIVHEGHCSSRELEEVRVPGYPMRLTTEAQGWMFAAGRDWSCSQTFLDLLFSKDVDEASPLELPDWMSHAAGKAVPPRPR